MTKEQKQKIRDETKWLIRNGKLVLPDYCEWCNQTAGKLHIHHRNYYDPMDVIRLCTACHHYHHKRDYESVPYQRKTELPE